MIMNNLTVTLFRLFGVLIISNFILYLNFIFQIIKQILITNHQYYIIPVVVFFLFPIVIGTFMIFIPHQFSKKIKDISKKDNEDYKLKEILGICIILLGMFFLINSIIMIIIELLQALLINFKVNSVEKFDITSISYIFGYIVKILIGLLFIFKGMRISNYIINR